MSKDSLKYTKVSQREHVLLRPDTYVGDITQTEDQIHIYDEIDNKIIKKNISYVPGFFKCFDEILVNAYDHSKRDNTLDYIKVEYNKEDGFISVENNGDNGIPVEVHPDHGIYTPSLIFGELLSGSNFDDTEKREGAGRNGMGATLANIFSLKFIVEIVDNKRNKKFYQEWTNNMEILSKPKVTNSKSKPYIKITFYPDFKKFNIENLNNDHYNLFYRRCIDIAGISKNIKVHFNNNLIKVNSFKSYISLYYPEETLYFDDSNEKWTVGVIYKQESNNEVISFVNSNNCYKGGTHVISVVDSIIKSLITDIQKKDKNIKISPVLLKDNLIFFINCTLENPSFSSQTKVECVLKANKFGSTYTPQQAFLKKLTKCGIIEQVIELAKFKESSSLKKTDGKKQVRLLGLPKLSDANRAGTKDSMKCSLILTEGDSALSFAIAGLSSIKNSRDIFGSFPLKGKLLNAREATPTQLMNNEEINNLKKIIGLKHGEDYSDDSKFNQLRYGRIIILTDQDTDGSHIKGLVMNFIHTLWPTLLCREHFICSLSTPIVKAFKNKDVKTFYTLKEYNDWVSENDTHTWKIKYYKGLGTSTSSEAQEYFLDIEDKLINYFWKKDTNNIEIENKIEENDENKIEETDDDEEKENDYEEKENDEENQIELSNKFIKNYNKDNDLDAILLAFDKDRADDRKVWLQNYDKNDIIMYDKKDIRYSQFIHSDLIHFSNDDLSRSIPSLIDGLKPSQRKILYGAFLRGLDKDEVKVAQLAGFVSDRAAYHHGEASLMGAIIGMAQNYMGSNNINLLKPNGQFGCLSPETPILLWDGTIKCANEISVDDELVGDDGEKRQVLRLVSGIDDMYKVTVKDTLESFICNSQHILTLMNTNNKQIIDIKLIDYLKLNNNITENLLLISNTNSINWSRQRVPLDPYIFGLWLGSEFKNNKFVINNDKIIEKINKWLNIYNVCNNQNNKISNIICYKESLYTKLINIRIFKNSNPIKQILKNNNLLYNKHIPRCYLINDKETRLQLLAGIIDICGKVCAKYDGYEVYHKYYQIVLNNNKLIDSLDFISKSLGFTTRKFDNELLIDGHGNNISCIPSLLYNITNNRNINNNNKFFNIKYMGENVFYGWQVDKNERFLLGNFIVTHNSRLKNGSDAASPRYIWTKLEDLTTIIFNPLDSHVLNNQTEDNQPIEPEYYAPIIPMILVNGSQGIGTGFSTKIPPFNPKDIINNVKLKIQNKEMLMIDPWWHGFEGTVSKIDNNNYEIKGSWIIKDNKVIITELPVGESTSGYKEFLEKLLETDEPVKTTKNKKDTKKVVKKEKKENPFLSYIENCTDTKIYFELTFESGYLESINDFDKQYHLVKKYSLNNMNLFDKRGTITKFNSVLDIINTYYETRLEIYKKRKEYQLSILNHQLQVINYKVKFILMIVNKKLIVNNKKKHELEEELEKYNFPKLSISYNDTNVSYNYLLGMPIYNLTFEKIEELKKQEEEKQIEHDELDKLSPSDIWLHELNKLENEYDKFISHNIVKTDKSIKKDKNIKKSKK